MSKITVIGAGNGGMTAAYHFARNGHEVCIYDSPDFPAQIDAIHRQGGIEALEEDHGCRMILPGFASISLATTDIRQAMEFGEIFVMVCPSFAQEILFGNMLPFLRDGMKIVVMPGNYGGLVLNQMVKESEKAGTDLTFIDTITIPWACRIVRPGVLTIMGIKEFLPLSIFPSEKKTEEVRRMVEEIMPIPVELLENPVVAGLENINFGGHPLLTTLNIGLLENFNGEFNYYKDCCSPATARAAAKMDLERLSVGKALGLKLRTELEAMNALYACEEKTVYDFNRKSTTHGKINNAPNSSRARYITEDVPYLLVPCYELAKACGLEVPIVRSCITIASAYNDENYFESGRTLKKMGFSAGTKEEILKFLGC